MVEDEVPVVEADSVEDLIVMASVILIDIVEMIKGY